MVISEAPGGPGGLGRGPKLQLVRSVERCGQHALIADTRPTFLTPRGGYIGTGSAKILFGIYHNIYVIDIRRLIVLYIYIIFISCHIHVQPVHAWQRIPS